MHALSNFNSIKVQLELGMLYEDMYLTAFQFHKGTIRTQQQKKRGLFLAISIP